MKPQTLLFSILLICLVGFHGPVTAPTGKGAPTETEVRSWFTKYNADWTISHEYTQPGTTFQRIRIAPPTRYNFVGVGWQVCYPVKLDWTNTYTYAYRRWRYTERLTNNYFRLYRDDFGELTIGDHMPGQSQTGKQTF